MNNRATFIAARPHANAENAARTAAEARAEVEVLRALAPVEAAGQTRAAEQAAREAAERALKERARQIHADNLRPDGRNNDGLSLGH